jgi:hypothetical protein
MILNYLREKIYRRTQFARQYWEVKNNMHESNLFNELNFEYKSFGKKNPKKVFFVIKRSPGAGFFANLVFVIHNLYICDKLNMTPVIDMENYQTFYNCKNKINNSFNSWNYYFKPVTNYKLSEVYQSKNVVICDKRTSAKGYDVNNYKSNFKFFNGFQFLDKRHKEIVRKYIKINKDIISEADDVKIKFKNNKVLGICFRGSDSKKNAYQPHTPTKKQMIYATNFLLTKYKFDKIYLCTEDLDYLDLYNKHYGKILIFNKNSPRTTDAKDLFDSQKKNHRFLVGKGNLVDMLALTAVDYMLFGVSNIPYTSLFFAKKKIPHSVIDNGMRGGILMSGFSWNIKSVLPGFMGGFTNHIITKNKLIKKHDSDFEII